MDDSKLLDEFLKKFSSVNNEINNNIYNEKSQKKPFILQYKQLISYFNFKKKLEKKLRVKQFPKEIKNQNEIKNKLSPNKTIIQKNYCLIDKKWIEKWKKHIGFNEIEKYCKENNITRELNNKDYNWISQIIEKNYKENYLNPLDMSNIYKDNKLDLFVDFEIVDKNCYELFIKGSKNPKENKNYPIIIFKEKFILDLNQNIIWIKFKENKKKISQEYFEILVYFEEIKEKENEKKKIIDILMEEDISEWLKKNYFDLDSDIDKTLYIYNCKIKIINKTLKNIREKNIGNNINPCIDEGKEILNLNTISKNSIYLCQIQMLSNLQQSTNIILKNNLVYKKNDKTNNKYNQKFNNSTNKLEIEDKKSKLNNFKKIDDLNNITEKCLKAINDNKSILIKNNINIDNKIIKNDNNLINNDIDNNKIFINNNKNDNYNEDNAYNKRNTCEVFDLMKNYKNKENIQNQSNLYDNSTNDNLF